MFLRNKDVLDVYRKQTGNSVDSRVAMTYVVLIDQCQKQKHCWDFNDKKFNREQKIKSMVQKRAQIRKAKPEIIQKFEEELFVNLINLEDDRHNLIIVEDDEQQTRTEQNTHRHPGGRPPKRLSENPSNRTTNKILDGILCNLTSVADEQQISVTDLLRALLQRHTSNKNSVEEKDLSDMPVQEACSMIYNINFSVNQYQELRISLLPHGFSLPTRNLVDNYKKSLLPKNITSSTHKASCEINEVVKQTVESLLEITNTSVSSLSKLTVFAKFGLHGSGSHKIRHQKDPDLDSESDILDDEEKSKVSYLGGFWCPLQVEHNHDIIWKNPIPNSILYARPVCLLRGKEDRETVTEHFKPIMDQLTVIENEPILFNVPISDNVFNSCSGNVVTEVSMIDGKMADILQGDSGAFCHYCTVTRAEANDLRRIEEGFFIEKSFDTCMEIWEGMQSGEIPYHDKKQAGQVHEPITSKNMRFYGITHQKLCSLDHMEKLLYHLVSGQTHTWSEDNWRVKDALKVAKNTVINSLHKECGFLMDTPTSGGGNTDTGGIADKFF